MRSEETYTTGGKLDLFNSLVKWVISAGDVGKILDNFLGVLCLSGTRLATIKVRQGWKER